MSKFGDLIMTTLGNAANTGASVLENYAWSQLDRLKNKKNGGKSGNLRFYYSADGAGGTLYQVLTRSIAGGAVEDLKNMAKNGFNSLLNGNKKSGLSDSPKTTEKGTAISGWGKEEAEQAEKEFSTYGRMKLDNGTVYALDDWGDITPEALMLAIDVDTKVQISQQFPGYRGISKSGGTVNSFESNTLVWYDTTAMININSDKNFISTKVQGRDYSRKELVSNGDIKFSVSGQITNRYADLYPSDEVQKFLKVMKYKGVIKVNNQLLDQFGITHIVITDFNLKSKQGSKSVQEYSFSGLGLQPEKETEITNDTVKFEEPKPTTTNEEEQKNNKWLDLLPISVSELKSKAQDTVDETIDWSADLLNKLLDKSL